MHKTIDSLLDNARNEIEIIVVLDGYWPDTPIKSDPRIKIVHLGKNVGMREAINTGVRVSKGEFIMRTDEHCMFCPNYDSILTANLEQQEIHSPVRYFLDPEKWEVMDIKPFVYEKLVLREDMKFEGQRWHSRNRERKNIMIDENMAMQGSCWVMTRYWWNACIKELQTEGYGRHYQDSHEMVFKTWKAGGKLMINKLAWYAHKYYKFPRTHNEAHDARKSWDYSIKMWKDYYLNEVKPKWNI